MGLEFGANIVIIIGTVIFSIIGFQRKDIFDRYKFNPYVILKHKDWVRIISHAFLHSGPLHLGLNMFVLYMFGGIVEGYFRLRYGDGLGILLYVLLYLTAGIASTVPSFRKHGNNAYYNAIGASGAVSAIVFANILLLPTAEMGLLIIPGIYLPGFIFGFLYLLGESVMSKRGTSNIGHDAHIGGAVYGMLFMVIIDWHHLTGFLSQISQYFMSFFG